MTQRRYFILPFNELSPRQAELFDLMQEECAEAIQAIAKVKRHGLESYNPDDTEAGSNKEQMERELGQVLACIELLDKNGIISAAALKKHKDAKLKNVLEYLHHYKDVS